MANKRMKLEGLEMRAEIGDVGFKNVCEYWTARPLLLSMLIVAAFVSPFVGFFVAGAWPGAIIGLCVSVATFVAGFFAATRHRDEIRSR